MAKLVTTKRLEGEFDRAQEYVKTHILFPSSVLGLIFMVAGATALIYQFVLKIYGWQTFLQSTGLILVGAVLGWGQTRYHRYVLSEHPAYFAARMKTFGPARMKSAKRGSPASELQHPGRNLVPAFYVLGFVILFGIAGLASTYGEVFFVAAFTLPWAGFFWAKLYFWRDIFAARRP